MRQIQGAQRQLDSSKKKEAYFSIHFLEISLLSAASQSNA